MRLPIVVIAFSWLPSSLLAQTVFQRLLGGDTIDEGNAVIQLPSAEIVIAGGTNSFVFGGWDGYMSKLTPTGELVWARPYGGSADDYWYDAKRTSDGGYILAGYTESYGAGAKDIYLMKTNDQGFASWSTTFGGIGDEIGYSAQETDDGGFIIVGETNSYGAGGTDILVIKTDINGDSIWSKVIGGVADEYAYEVVQRADLSYTVVGSTESFGAGVSDVYMIRLDAVGDTIATRTYGGTGADVGYSLQETNDLGLIIVGETNSFGFGGQDIYLIKTLPNEDTLWTKVYGGNDVDVGENVKQVSDFGFLITGHTTSFGAGAEDMLVVKTELNGDLTWASVYGETGSELGYSCIEAVNDGYILIGETSSFGMTNPDMYLVKTDYTGISNCFEQLVSLFVTSTQTISQQGGSLNSGVQDSSFTSQVGFVIPNDSLLCINCNSGISLVVTDVSCNGDGDGSIDLTVIGNVTPYMYNWSTGSTWQDIAGLDGGWYAVTVTDSVGCEIIDSVFVAEPLPISFNLSSTAASCPTCCDACVNVNNLTGDCPPYSYSWLPNSPLPCSGCPGTTYTVTITDSCNCTIIDSIKPDTVPVGLVERINEEGNVSVFPSPTSGIFTVAGTSSEIHIYDLYGRLVMSTTERKIDMSNQLDGIYLLRINSPTGHSSYGKLVIQH